MADFIKREEAINFARSSAGAAYNRDDFYAYRALNDFIVTLISIPAADVVPVRHAKWVLIDECVNEGVYCSNCHKKIYRAEYANQKVKSNFCPNCGAKMELEAD